MKKKTKLKKKVKLNKNVQVIYRRKLILFYEININSNGWRQIPYTENKIEWKKNMKSQKYTLKLFFKILGSYLVKWM